MAAVKRCAILDTPADGSFDRLTAIAARFNVPISIISIVDSDRIWFKSHPGLGVNAVAAQANGDRKRDQFASLVMEVTGLLTGAAQGDIALDGIGVELAKAADPGDELLTVVVPVVHMHDTLLFRAIWDGDWEGDGLCSRGAKPMPIGSMSRADHTVTEPFTQDPLSAMAPLLRVRPELQEVSGLLRNGTPCTKRSRPAGPNFIS